MGRFYWKLVFFVPGAAIGFIVLSGIERINETTAMAIRFLGASAGGSLTTALGSVLFLRAESEGASSGGFISVLIRTLLIAMVIVAAILALAKMGILNRP